MPKATVTQNTVRRELRSIKVLPGEDTAFVELRTLSFHEMNMRSDIAARMYQETAAPKKGQKQSKDETVRGYFEIMNVAVTEFEFRNCIVNHNLENENGELIDFTRPMQSWRLDPKVGQEIGKYIDELNQFDVDEEELVPLGIAPSSSSLEENTELGSSTPSV